METTDLSGPFTALSAVFAFFAHLLGYVDVVIHAVWATVPSWYPALAISASTILPTLGPVTLDVPLVGTHVVALSGGALDAVVVVGAVVYVGYLVDRGLDKLQEDNKS